MARQPNKHNIRRDQPTDAPAKAEGRSWLHQSAAWPVYESLLSDKWDEENAIVTALVSRQSPRSGKIAAASFLVDLGCLGVKSAFVRMCKSPDEYRRRLRTPLLDETPMQPADFDLVARVILTGLAYAEGLGISPDPEFRQARILLTGAHPEACTTPILVGGPEGKPIFVARQNDDVARILSQLARTLGPDGFYYMLPGDTDKQVFRTRLPGMDESAA